MKKNDNMFYLVVLIICISIAILARIMNPGWVLIAGILTYGIGPAYIYFFFVINYNMINSNNYKEIKNILFIASCITFLVAFIVYPDFLDSPNSTRAVFGTISDKNVLYEFKSIGFNSIIINAIINLISFVFIYTSREPEKNKFGKILIPNFIKHDKNQNTNNNIENNASVHNSNSNFVNPKIIDEYNLNDKVKYGENSSISSGFRKDMKNLNEIKNKLIDNNKKTENKEVKPIKISLTKLILITLLLIAVLVGVVLIVINIYTK